jgi:hypothetical protein
MNKISIAAIAVASALLTPLVVNAAGRTEPLKPIVVAEAAMTAASASQSTTAPAPDGCTRRVRVVYAAAYQLPRRLRCCWRDQLRGSSPMIDLDVLTRLISALAVAALVFGSPQMSGLL